MTWGASGVNVRIDGHTALTDVDVDVPAGMITAVVGGDGAGKTTLLNTLIGRRQPYTGEVHMPASFGFMPSTSGVWRDLTVEENVSFVADAYHLTGDRRRKRAQRLLGAAGLMDVGGRLGGELSGGMRQKLGFVLALLPDPEILVLDEPSTGVDPVSRVELWRLLAQAASAGMPIILSTSYLDEAERCGQVIVLDNGRVLHAGTPDQMLAAVPGTIVDAADRADLPRWRRGHALHGWHPGAPAPGERAVPLDLEDAVIATMIAQEHAGVAREQTASASSAQTVPARHLGDHPLVRCVEATKRFGDVTAVDRVSIDVRPGEIVGLLGANGAGKTTLISLILGLAAADGGQIALFGDEPSRRTRARLGYLAQGLGLYEDLTVMENMAFVVGAFGVTDVPPVPESLVALSRQLVGSIGLGAQRQLGFHCALLHRPEVLILDEPTSGVDPLARARLWDTIHEQAEQGVAVLVTTHYMQEAEQCDRLVLMAHGRRIAGGRESDIIGDTTAVQVTAPQWQTAFNALSTAGVPVSLSGTHVRAVGVDRQAVVAALAGMPDVTIDEVPATLEEAMVLADV